MKLYTIVGALVALSTLGGCAAEVGQAESTEQASIQEDNPGNQWGIMPFIVTSEDFEDGEALPDAHTCEAKPFGDGISPQLSWTKASESTKSYAVLFTDISLIETPRFAYHWAAWNIPHSVHEIPQDIGEGQFPEVLKGGEQLRPGPPGAAPRFFGPCPSWQHLCDGLPRSNDTYTFTVYAFDEKDLTPPEGASLEDLANYFEEHAEAKAEIFATSDAAPASAPFCPDA